MTTDSLAPPPRPSPPLAPPLARRSPRRTAHPCDPLATQSADLDIVTGATYTSRRYIASLQSSTDEAVALGALAAA